LALAMARTVLPKNFKLGRGFTGDARATSGVGTVVGAPPAQDARTGALARARDASLDSTLREYSRARASARAWPSPSGDIETPRPGDECGVDAPNASKSIDHRRERP
jgi:hypothetical protein